MTFAIKANWIKEIREGHNSNWNYDYKEYVFNENFTESAWIRIPLNAPGIKAMDYSTGQGIQAEYSQVYLDNDGTITTIFDINLAAMGRVTELVEQVESLTKERNQLISDNRDLNNLNNDLQDKVDDLKIYRKDTQLEIWGLKARLYDLMTAGA